jgi:hypothetical protein
MAVAAVAAVPVETNVIQITREMVALVAHLLVIMEVLQALGEMRVIREEMVPVVVMAPLV